MIRPLRDVPARPDLLLPALAAALSGEGPAVAPGTERVAADVPDDVAVAVRTSGSTGEPRTALLSATALRASAAATHDRLAGPGHWLLALPTDHVAGLQVLVRSVLAGTTPTTTASPFRPAAFVAAVDAMPTGGPRYTSLVPTQLVRLLDDAAATAALRSFDAVLLGGAAAAPDLLTRARAADVAVVTTYGMTETCGGCVYDGRALDAVAVRLDADGRILLSGPVLADGYLGRPDLDAEAFVQVDGIRHLRTSDLGAWVDGSLVVLGRADDVLVSGGVKVSPAQVESVVASLPGVAETVVVGVPDAEWGQAVVALVAVRAGARPPTLPQVRAAVTEVLGATHAPRHLVVTDSLPVRGPGKIDRRAATLLATRQLERNLT